MARSQMTVLDALALRLASDPDGPYLDFEGVTYTARQMDDESTRIAHALAGLGLGHGDRVATLIENRAEQVVSFFAVLKLGAIQVPINTAYKGDFLRHQIVDSGATVFIVQGDFASRAVEVVGETPDLAHCVVVDQPDAVIDALPVHAWHDLLAQGTTTPIDSSGVRPR